MVECVLQGERSLLMQVVTPVEVCNHGPEGSELHKIACKGCYGYLLSPSSLGLGIEGCSELWLLT